MKLEEGMYVRTYDNGIDKFNFKYKRDGHNFYTFYFEKYSLTNPEYYIMGEPSFNIIDLIEPKDIIVGIDGHIFEVYAVGSDCVYINGLKEFIYEHEIKSIVTKEQFESMEYKVGE